MSARHICKAPRAHLFTQTVRARSFSATRLNATSQPPPFNSPSPLRLPKKVIEARGKGEELHPNVRRGAPPEFDGDKNPKTGEVGGPKNEPLRWGAAGEWSYNGRTTDF